MPGDFLLRVPYPAPFEYPTLKAARKFFPIKFNRLYLAGKSPKSPALERNGAREPIFAENARSRPPREFENPRETTGISKPTQG
jgi:hypothetical protein